MAGTNQITFTDKVNTRTLPIPSQNKVRDVDLNEIKQEHNALDNIVTDPMTGLVKVVEDLAADLGTAESSISALETGKQDDLDIIDETTYLLTPKPIQEGIEAETKYQTETDVLALFPINDDRTIDLIDDKASIVSQYIPTSGTVLNFDAPRSYGRWKSPVSTITVDFTSPKPVQKSIVFLQAVSVPFDISEDRAYVLPWVGDVFNGSSGFVNKLEISYTTEDEPEIRFLEIRNTAIDIGALAVDADWIGFWQGEDVGDDSILFDSTIYENTATTSSAANSDRVTGKVGNAVRINDTTSVHKFSIANNISMNFENGITCGGWYNFAALGSTNAMMSKDIENSIGFILYKNTDNRFRFELGVNRVSSRVNPTFVYDTIDVWVHVMATYDGTTGRMYINGSEAGTKSYTGSVDTSTGALYVIGADNLTLRTNCLADQVRLYRRVLSSAEILAIYNAENI